MAHLLRPETVQGPPHRQGVPTSLLSSQRSYSPAPQSSRTTSPFSHHSTRSGDPLLPQPPGDTGPSQGLGSLSPDTVPSERASVPAAYIGILISLTLFAVALPAAYPFSKRLLPRQFYGLADLMAMCHEARFLGSPYLDIADKRATPTKEHMEARLMLSGDKFRFGKYRGRDNHWHLGFDVLSNETGEDGELKDAKRVQLIREKPWETLKAATFTRMRSIRGYQPVNAGPFRQAGRDLHDAAGEGELYEMSGGLPSATATGASQEVRSDPRHRQARFVPGLRSP